MEVARWGAGVDEALGRVSSAHHCRTGGAVSDDGQGSSGDEARPAPSKRGRTPETPTKRVRRVMPCCICKEAPLKDGLNWHEQDKDERGRNMAVGEICKSCGAYVDRSPFDLKQLQQQQAPRVSVCQIHSVSSSISVGAVYLLLVGAIS